MIGYFKMIVNGNIDLSGSDNLESLGELERVNGFINLSVCDKLLDLGKLKIINGDFKFHYSYISTLQNIKMIDGDCSLFNSIKLTSLRNLKKVSGVLNLSHSIHLESLGDLEEVDGEFINITYCKKLKDLGKLKLNKDLKIYYKRSGITKKIINKKYKEFEECFINI